MRHHRATYRRALAGATGLALAAALLAGCAGMAEAASASAPADITIVGTRVFPESVTSDSAGNVYASSNGGTIYRAPPGASEATAWIVPNEENGLSSLFGVFADETHGVLWACSNPNLFIKPTPPGPSALKAFDLKTGAFVASYALPGDGNACNDIAVAPDGTIWLSETMKGGIYTLAPGAKALSEFAKGEELIGIDGLAFADDGKLYINNVRQNLVQRVERKADGSYGGLATLTLSLPLNGPDGLRSIGGNRFLQAEGPEGRVALIEVNGDSATVTPVKTGLESSPAVTRVGKVGYASEGKINYLFDPALRDKDPGTFMIRAFTLPEEP